jgi:transposase
MPSVTSAVGPIHLGMDTSKNTIVVGILNPGEEVPVLDRIWNEEGAVRHLIGRLGEVGALRVCYEAGPGGFELYRLLASMGWPVMWWRRR